PICNLGDLSTDKAVDLRIANQRLIIARSGNDAHIYQGFCTHMLFPLAGSKIADCVMTCGLHHSTFDVRDGSVQTWSEFPPVVGPALGALRGYETKVENGKVFVSWAAARPDSIPVHVKL